MRGRGSGAGGNKAFCPTLLRSLAHKSGTWARVRGHMAASPQSPPCPGPTSLAHLQGLFRGRRAAAGLSAVSMGPAALETKHKGFGPTATRVMLGGHTDGKKGGAGVSSASLTGLGVSAGSTRGLRHGRRERGLGSHGLKTVSATESRGAVSRAWEPSGTQALRQGIGGLTVRVSGGLRTTLGARAGFRLPVPGAKSALGGAEV